MDTNRQKLVLRLHKEGHISDEEAIELLKTEKEYVNTWSGPGLPPYYCETIRPLGTGRTTHIIH